MKKRVSSSVDSIKRKKRASSVDSIRGGEEEGGVEKKRNSSDNYCKRALLIGCNKDWNGVTSSDCCTYQFSYFRFESHDLIEKIENYLEKKYGWNKYIIEESKKYREEKYLSKQGQLMGYHLTRNDIEKLIQCEKCYNSPYKLTSKNWINPPCFQCHCN